MNNLPTETIASILNRFDRIFNAVVELNAKKEVIGSIPFADGHNLNDLREILALRESRPQWISVDDRLPYDEDASCFLTVGGFAIPYVLYFDGGDTEAWYEVDTDELILGVTHWMPLPRSPQDED